MELKDFLVKQSERARRISIMSDWFGMNSAALLCEHYRYAQRVVLDFIDLVNAECKDMNDVRELLDHEKYLCFNDYKYFQSEHFDDFAGLAMTKYQALLHIERDVRE